MRFERGPYGKIAVMTMEPDSGLVMHAFDALQMRDVRAFLPVYLREQLGRAQFCFDCTGFLPLTEIKSLTWSSQIEKRKCIAEFLGAILDAEDHFVDPGFLVMDPEYIFFDPENRRLFWCCVPVLSHSGKISDFQAPNGTDFPEQKLEQLLMHPFFSEVIGDEERSRLICLFRDDREDEISDMLRNIAEQPIPPKYGIRFKSMTSRLSALLIIMVSTLAAFILLGKFLSTFPSFQVWTGWYILVFSFLLAIVLVSCTEKEDCIAVPISAVSKESAATGLSPTELYFPGSRYVKEKASGSRNGYSSPLFLPGYLEQAPGPAMLRGKNPIRAVIWVDDFLIGRDSMLCDLFIDNPSIADRHARILHRGNLFFLMDVGSKTGTFIGSRRLYTYEENPLEDGDLIAFGDLKFIFSQPKDP